MSDITTGLSKSDPSDDDDNVDLAADEIGFEPEVEDVPVEAELRRRDSNGKPYGRSTATIAAAVCDDYLEANSIPTLRRTAPSVVADDLLGLINEKIWAQNEMLKEHLINGRKLEPVKRLGFAEVARLVGALDRVISIAPSKSNTDPGLNALAVYDDDPASPHYGTYRTSDVVLSGRAARYSPDMTTKEFKEVRAALTRTAPRVVRGQNKDLLAVKNGVIDYNGGEPIFMDFSPEHVFLSKLDVNWNPDATNTVIHNAEDGTDWDVESWMSELSDDAEIVNLLWEIIGATVRPYVSWNRAAFFFATSGNNGKGTLLSLMRNILGVGNYASIPLADFSQPFLLEPLLRASAILVDENDVGVYLDRVANLKAVITNDEMTINPKHRAPVSHQHFGFMVQCLNDKPALKDKSESFYRRQLFIPFTKSFTGAERKYIKDDYLTRTDVLEYVLKRVLEMNYYSLSEPAAVKAALEDFKESNDPVRAFWNEKKYEFSWDLVPFQFAYDLYRGWLARNNPQAKPIGRNKFTDELVELVNSDKLSPFECPDKTLRHRPGGRMNTPEPLIVEFDLQDWMNLSAPASNPTKRSTLSGDQIKSTYRGLVRKDVHPAPELAAVAEAQKSQRINELSEEPSAAQAGTPAAGETVPEPVAPAPQSPGFATPVHQQPAAPAPTPTVLPASAAGHRALFEQWEPAAPPSDPGAITPVTSAPPSIVDACQITPAYDLE